MDIDENSFEQFLREITPDSKKYWNSRKYEDLTEQQQAIVDAMKAGTLKVVSSIKGKRIVVSDLKWPGVHLVSRDKI